MIIIVRSYGLQQTWRYEQRKPSQIIKKTSPDLQVNTLLSSKIREKFVFVAQRLATIMHLQRRHDVRCVLANSIREQAEKKQMLAAIIREHRRIKTEARDDYAGARGERQRLATITWIHVHQHSSKSKGTNISRWTYQMRLLRWSSLMHQTC